VLLDASKDKRCVPPRFYRRELINCADKFLIEKVIYDLEDIYIGLTRFA
jgi:hypothetical protein